jgi:DNA-directed RNA polymerase subunit RPC12/RpoP
MEEIYQCKSCGCLLLTSKGSKKPLFCTVCRGGLVPVEVKVDKWKSYQCPNCNFIFSLEERVKPYKCPHCNYTFVTTPHRKFDERL